MPTLRGSLGDTINALSRLLPESRNEKEEKQIRAQISILNLLLAEVFKQDIKNDTQKFNDAVDLLKKATKSAKEAKKKLDKIGKAVKIASKAAKAVDKVLGFLISALA